MVTAGSSWTIEIQEDGTIQMIGDRLAALLGYASQDLVGQHYQSLILKSGHEAVEKFLACSIFGASDLPEPEILRMVHKEGTISARLFGLASRTAKRVILRLYQEDTLTVRSSPREITTEHVINATYDGIWDWYIQDDYEYMSPRFWEILGYEPHEKKHHPSEWQDLIFEEDLPHTLDNYDKHVATRGKHPFQQHVRYRHKSGSLVYINCRGRVLEWGPDGEPIRMLGAHTDITRIYEAEKALRDSDQIKNLIIDSIPEFVFVKDRESRLIIANPALRAAFPDSMQDKIIGHTTYESFDPEEAQAFLDEDQKAFEKGDSRVMESLAFPDGKRRLLDSRKIRFQTPDKKDYILCLSTDVTERETLISDLKRSNEELDHFAHIAAHDLKEPIRGMHNHAYLLRKELGDAVTEDAEKRLDRISDLTTRMDQLINDLMHFSKLGRTDLSVKEVALSDLVQEVLEKLTQEAYGGFDIQIENELPTVVCDAVRITEVFSNLITNALKYNNNDNKIVRIREEKTKIYGHKRSVIKVSDNGIGIAPKFQDSVFEMFRRLHKKTDYGGGTGSGLSIVKRIIDQHNGEIWIESEPGKGTTFAFYLG